MAPVYLPGCDPGGGVPAAAAVCGSDHSTGSGGHPSLPEGVAAAAAAAAAGVLSPAEATGEDLLYFRHSLPTAAAYSVAYGVVFLTGLAGNGIVLSLIVRSRVLHRPTHIFIANLAVADVLVLVFCLPATLVANIFVPWMLGRAMCKMVTYVQGVSVVASVYSLVAVSIDRFLVICFPLRFQFSKQRAAVVIVNIWLLSLLLTLPWALYFDLHRLDGYPDVLVCIEAWPEGQDGKLYFLAVHLVLCYVLPLIVISVCYALIWAKVWYRQIPGESKDSQLEKMRQKSRFKVVKMLMVVVFFFAASWAPLYAIFTRIHFFAEPSSWEQHLLAVALPFAQWLGSANSCVNPILYAFFSAKYRRGFVAVIRHCRCWGALREDYAAGGGGGGARFNRSTVNSYVHVGAGRYCASGSSGATAYPLRRSARANTELLLPPPSGSGAGKDHRLPPE